MARLIEDVLHIIFSNLNYDDLMRASQVCKSWNYVAELEKQKRGPQLINLSYSNFYEKVEGKVLVKPLYKFLLAKPAIIFSFSSSNGIISNQLNGTNDSKYLTQFDNLQFAHVNFRTVYFKNKSVNAVGLFLPERDSVSYDIVSVKIGTIMASASIDNGDFEFKKIMDNFLIDKEGHKTIIFGCLYNLFPGEPYRQNPQVEHFIERVFDCISQRYEPGSYSLWGMYTCFMHYANNKEYQFRRLQTEFLAVTISGSPVQSHSLLLDIDVFLNDGFHLVEDILSKISSNSNIVLFAVPSESLASKISLIEERVKVLQDGFPSLQTMIAITESKVFGINSHEKESRPVAADNRVSILILGYK